MEQINKRKYFIFLLALAIMIYSISNVTAIAITQVQTGSLAYGRGTGGLIFNPTGTKLYTIDNWHGSKLNYIYEYSLSSPYDITTLSPTGNSINLSTIPIPSDSQYNKSYVIGDCSYCVSSGYITRDGNNLYITIANYNSDLLNTNDHTGVQFDVIHYRMNNFNLSSIVFSEDKVFNVTNLWVVQNSYSSPSMFGVYVSDGGNYMILSGLARFGDSQTSPYLRAFDMSTPFNLTGITNRSLPFLWSRTDYSPYGAYYNVWVSPDSSTYAYIERDLHQSAYTLFIGNNNVVNGTQQRVQQSFNKEGLTMVSTFNDIFLFTQSGGTLYKYSVSNLTLQTNNVSSASSNAFVVGFINPILDIFPDHTELSLGQKLGIVLVVMLASAIILLFAGAQSRTEGLHSFMIYVVGLVLIIEFFFFVGIQYIPVGFFISLILIAVALAYLATKMRGG